MEEANGGRWAYRCEGNSNLVVADTQRSVVLRILKEPLTLPEDVAGVLVQTKVKRIKSFFEEVVNPRLRYALIPKIVLLDTSTMKAIKSQIDGERPAHRKNEGKYVRALAATALELPDLCSAAAFGRVLDDTAAAVDSAAPVFTVELKPKMGYIVQPPAASQPGAVDGYSHNGKQKFGCFLCISEHYPKLQDRSKIDGSGCLMRTATNFCPADLFSGNRKRMLYALGALLDSHETLPNRFRLFKDGVQVKPTMRSNLSKDQHRQFITSSLHPYFRDASGQTSVDELFSLIAEALLHSDTMSTAGDALDTARILSGAKANSFVNGDTVSGLASCNISENVTESSNSRDSAIIALAQQQLAVDSSAIIESAQHQQRPAATASAVLCRSDIAPADGDKRRGSMVARTCDFSPLSVCVDTNWQPAPLPVGCVLDELLRALCHSRETGDSIYEKYYVQLVKGAAAAGSLPTSPFVATPPTSSPEESRCCHNSVHASGSAYTHAQLEQLHRAALSDPDFHLTEDLSVWWNTSGRRGMNGLLGDCQPPPATLYDSIGNVRLCDGKADAATKSPGHCCATEAALRKIIDFLFAKTVKDCSIMITLQPLETPAAGSSPPSRRTADSSSVGDGYGNDDEQCGSFVVLDSASDAVRYRVKVALVDLDPKPFSKIPVYARLQRHYARSLLSGSCCCG